MIVNELEQNKKIENELEQTSDQKSFLETTLGKTINIAIDIGIRALLPDFIEDQVIKLKDNLFEYGLKDGIKETIEDAVDLGKSALGIITGDFQNINQVQNAIQSGGIIDGMSTIIDVVVNKINEKGLINNTIANTLKQGKNIILDNIENNIEKTLTNQINSIEKVNTYMNDWKNCYNNKDFEGMEKEYEKLEKEIKNLIPLENTIKQARNVENIHNLIKNNGKDFNLTPEALELAYKL